MNERLLTLRADVLEKLQNTQRKVEEATGDDLFDLIDPHVDFPHCENFLVSLVNDLKELITGYGYKITKVELVNIYKEFSSKTDSNTLRANKIIESITK